MYLYAVTRKCDLESETRSSDDSSQRSEELIAVFTSPYRAHAFISSLAPREDASILVLKPSGILCWLVNMAARGATYVAINPTHFHDRVFHQQTISISRLLGDLGRTVIERIRALRTPSHAEENISDQLLHCAKCGKILRKRDSEIAIPNCCGQRMIIALIDPPRSPNPATHSSN